MQPRHLNVQLPQCPDNVLIRRLEAEADELCSLKGEKTNKQWLWLAMDTQTRQVIAFHVGDRSRKSARKLWKKIPTVYRNHAMFYADAYQPYQGVIPQAHIGRLVKRLARRITSNGSTARFDSEFQGWCGRPYPFPRN